MYLSTFSFFLNIVGSGDQLKSQNDESGTALATAESRAKVCGIDEPD